jgi:uncharacterized membrane protein HdeD (DUF308 family)
MLVFRGAAAVAFGALTLAWPTLTLLLLVVLFAVYVLAIGALALVAGFRARREDGSWLVSLIGLVSIAAGVLSVLYPRMTALVLVLIIGAGALITGVVDLTIAIRLRKEIRNEWFLGLAGVISIGFGAFVLVSPGAAPLALIGLIALQSIATGVLFIIIGLRIRRAREECVYPSPTRGKTDIALASRPDERHLDELLDKALADSFPASDPVSSLLTDDHIASATKGERP